MKVVKLVDRDFSQTEQENIDYLIKYYGKTNMAFVGEHCGVVLRVSKQELMINDCLEIIDEIKNGKKIVTGHVLEDGRGMVIVGSGKFFIQAISTGELSKEEITNDKMNKTSEKLLENYCLEAIEKPEIIALGLRHEFINFMEDSFIPIQQMTFPKD